MNKIKNIGISVLAVSSMLLSTCGNDFLEEKLDTQYSTEYFETAEGLEALSVSLYGNIRWLFAYDWSYGIVLYGGDEFTTGNDLTNEPWNTYDNRFGPVAATPALGAANNNCTSPAALWDQLYYGIASCNTIIDKADKITDLTVRNRCLAHAYFLRGYNYYRLTAQYGGVVLQTEPAVGVVRTFTRATEEQCWEQFVSDLRNAYNLVTGEVYTYGKGITWTKATAGHFLAKALLFRCSERSSAQFAKDGTSRTQADINADLQEAIAAATYTIGARGPLTPNYNQVFADWTGVDCAIEQNDEVLMAAGFNDTSSAQGRFSNRSSQHFAPQFNTFSGSWTTRGAWIGSADFQRTRPTEYTLAVFDHVNDSRLWKTFHTVYGINNISSGNAAMAASKGLALGDPSIVMILNTKNDTTYDSYTFGCNVQNPTWQDDNGRLADWTAGNRQTPTSGGLTTTTGKFVPNSLVLYQNGQYVAPTFKSTTFCNFFPGINKAYDGSRSGHAGSGYRDGTLARLAETYLVRAECYVRMGDYSNAQTDINVVRDRAQWKSGENRSYYVDGSQAVLTSSYNTASNIANYENANLNMNTYYLSNPTLAVTTAASDLQLTAFPGTLPQEDEDVMTQLGASSQYDRALHFILNERTRELLGEWQRWETLSRTGTLVQRARAFNAQAAPNITANKHELRPIPQAFIDGLLNDDGTNLTDAQKAAWQNPGY